MNCSVIICTHNPRPDYLRRALDALRAQSLPKERWELLLIDNASKEPLAGQWDLSWHPNARQIREEQLGLTPARLRGINESKADLLVFVDDDNVLAPDYLETALYIGLERPYLGAWGGRISGEYEIPVPAELTGYVGMLAIREFTQESWMYATGTKAIICAPYGAGMCVRRPVALYHLQEVKQRQRSLGLDRRGNELTSAGDTDMALRSCDIGLGVGLFPDLIVRHLIPATRLTHDYLLRLAEGLSYSHEILRQEREASGYQPWETIEPCISERLFAMYKRLRMWARKETDPSFKFAQCVKAAERRGVKRACAEFNSAGYKHD